MNGHDMEAYEAAFSPTEYDLYLAELDEADNAAWEFALLCATTDDLACPRCGYPVDVLDEAIVCPVCDEWWKDADELAADWPDDSDTPDLYSIHMAERAEGVAK